MPMGFISKTLNHSAACQLVRRELSNKNLANLGSRSLKVIETGAIR